MFSKLKHTIRNYFGFSKTETNGFLILLFLMVLMIFVPTLYKSYLISKSSFTEVKIVKLDSLALQVDKQILLTAKERSTNKPVAKLFDFNPNTVTVKDLESLGIDRKIAQRVANYRNKGGEFYKKEDLKKIYGLDVLEYERLKNHIIISKKTTTYNTELHKNNVKDKIKPFDINLADTTQLRKIYGIGSVLSGRIIKFRDGLGGFVSKDQYAEIYGLELDIVHKLDSSTFISDRFSAQKIGINTADVEQIAQHPYIRKKTAKLIVAYRQQHGNFESIEDLLKIHQMDEKIFLKIKPYIKL